MEPIAPVSGKVPVLFAILLSIMLMMAVAMTWPW
jgi:hypothetical protein